MQQVIAMIMMILGWGFLIIGCVVINPKMNSAESLHPLWPIRLAINVTLVMMLILSGTILWVAA